MSIWQSKFFFVNNLFCLFIFLWVLTIIWFFFIDFDSYYIVRTDDGQPRPKYIFNKFGTNIYFFLVHHHHRILQPKRSLGSLEVPKKVWAQSIQPFWRLLDKNEQTDRQTRKEYIDDDGEWIMIGIIWIMMGKIWIIVRKILVMKSKI